MVGTLNQSETGKVHVGGACAMHVWGVHVQCTHGGYIHNVHVGVHVQCMCGGTCTMCTWEVHAQCACGGCMRNEHVG